MRVSNQLLNPINDTMRNGMLTQSNAIEHVLAKIQSLVIHYTPMRDIDCN